MARGFEFGWESPSTPSSGDAVLRHSQKAEEQVHNHSQATWSKQEQNELKTKFCLYRLVRISQSLCFFFIPSLRLSTRLPRQKSVQESPKMLTRREINDGTSREEGPKTLPRRPLILGIHIGSSERGERKRGRRRGAAMSLSLRAPPLCSRAAAAIQLLGIVPH